MPMAQGNYGILVLWPMYFILDHMISVSLTTTKLQTGNSKGQVKVFNVSTGMAVKVSHEHYHWTGLW